jgi:hypothetical protein
MTLQYFGAAVSVEDVAAAIRADGSESFGVDAEFAYLTMGDPARRYRPR